MIPAWEEMDEALKPVLRRQMENYAGFLEHTDHHVGLLVDAVEQMGLLDDTLIYVIIGDNGASAEGTIHGTFNELISLNGSAELETPEFLMSQLDKLGGPESAPHYAVGWAHAMCTPYQWTKQVASHWGGTRNGTVVHWPNGISAKGEVRHQFAHVIDVAPTVLEAAGLPAPTQVNELGNDGDAASMDRARSTVVTSGERRADRPSTSSIGFRVPSARPGPRVASAVPKDAGSGVARAATSRKPNVLRIVDGRPGFVQRGARPCWEGRHHGTVCVADVLPRLSRADRRPRRS